VKIFNITINYVTIVKNHNAEQLETILAVYLLLVKLKNLENNDATTGWLSSGLNGANSVSFDGEFIFLFIFAYIFSHTQ